MKTFLLKVTATTLLSYLFIFSGAGMAQPCSDAGTASASLDSICPMGSTDLLLTSYIGNIQWQSFDGTNWTDETGTGATTDTYTVSPGMTTDYRAVVTASGCDPDTSALVTITVGVSAPTTAGASRCGYGPVTLSATGSGIKWYNVASGGAQLGTGTTFTPVVSATTTFYAASTLGGGPPSPMTTTFAGGNGFDGNMFDITAINTVTIDSFAANFNAGSGTAEIWYRPGTHVGFTNSNAGWTLAGTAPYTSTGNGAPGTSINVFVNVTIPAGQTYAFYVHGSGGITYTDGTALGNIFAQDANIEFKEGYGGAYFALTNFPRIFNGRILYSAGCESARTPVIATVNTATPATISSVPTALCLGQSATLTANSTNSGYTYTWSPSAGLSATTGTTVTYTPVGTGSTYITLVSDDGVCGYIDSILIVTGSPSVAGNAIISSDTVCLGDNATLFLTGSTGAIQWQSYNGSSWVNETGPGSTTAQYQVTPTTYSTYRAVVTSGGCDADTTVELSVEVLAITDPVVSNDTICGPGAANLTATGVGIMSWFTTASGGLNVFQGNTYSPSLTNTTTYYVEAAAGGTYNVGAPNPSIGTQFTLPGNDWGIQFDALAQCTLERVYVSPGATSGNITINLRDAAGGPVLNTVTVPVTANSGLVAVPLGFTINPGTGYRLELAAGSAACYYNSFGALYPYTVSNSPITLTGQINPNYSAGTFYYFFYDWVVTEGCKSNRIPVTGVVLPLPPTPTISPLWNTLTSSSPTGNQWYLNGNPIPGATGQVYVATQSGTYTVVVTGANGCTATSQQVFTTGIQELLSQNGFAVYPNPVADKLTIELAAPVNDRAVVTIYNVLGGLVRTIEIHQAKNDLEFNLPAGTYSIEIRSNNSVYRTKVLKM
ncbi:MAG TPA: T9SS type A sorting domain-containing protein [Bacteroidia bacterium]|nr:T9SS type A sorting domain-containing protein [Bacteroidia bacterium]